MRPTAPQSRQGSRAGYLLPAIAVALLVVGLAITLVLDRLWIDAARLELRTAAEAAALAGASKLVGDELLVDSFDPSRRAQSVRNAAAQVAAQNFAAGHPVALDAAPGEDVRLGQIVRDASGREVFLDTDDVPTTVLVYASRTRARSNPVGLFFRNLTGQHVADVIAPAEATIDSRVVGVRSLQGSAVPGLPLAILMDDPLGQRTDTWRHQIEKRLGGDRYSFDSRQETVHEKPDGIPEIVLHCASQQPTAEEESAANVHVVDVGTGLSGSHVGEQCRSGFTEDHLWDLGGSLRFDEGPVPLYGVPEINGTTYDALRSILGQPRICLLYASTEPSTSRQPGRVWTTRLVAGRVMAVAMNADGAVEVTLQPTFVTTRSALLREDLASRPIVSPDTYVYKLHLTQ